MRTLDKKTIFSELNSRCSESNELKISRKLGSTLVIDGKIPYSNKLGTDFKVRIEVYIDEYRFKVEFTTTNKYKIDDLTLMNCVKFNNSDFFLIVESPFKKLKSKSNLTFVYHGYPCYSEQDIANAISMSFTFLDDDNFSKNIAFFNEAKVGA